MGRLYYSKNAVGLSLISRKFVKKKLSIAFFTEFIEILYERPWRNISPIRSCLRHNLRFFQDILQSLKASSLDRQPTRRKFLFHFLSPFSVCAFMITPRRTIFRTNLSCDYKIYMKIIIKALRIQYLQSDTPHSTQRKKSVRFRARIFGFAKFYSFVVSSPSDESFF